MNKTKVNALTTKKKELPERTGANLEAFGPRSAQPKEFYSKHNLEVKYQTRSAVKIYFGRLETAKKYGYDANAYSLTVADKVAMLHLDYLDALLMSYRERVIKGLTNQPYMENLHSDWNWKNVLEKEWNSRPAPRMLSNFTKTMTSGDLLLEGLLAQKLPEFIKLWAKDLQAQLKFDRAFYVRLEKEFDKFIEEKLANI